MDGTARWLSAIVILQHLPVRHGRHLCVVEFQPPSVLVWFDENEIMSIIEVAGMYKYTVKPVLPEFGPVSRLVEEAAKVNLKGEFEAIINLRGRFRIEPITLRGCRWCLP